jgi:hypothetical protein
MRRRGESVSVALDRRLLLIDAEKFGRREQQSGQRSIADRDPILLALTGELLEEIRLLIHRQHCESRDIVERLQ